MRKGKFVEKCKTTLDFSHGIPVYLSGMTLQWICMQGQRKQDKADRETGPP